MERNSRVFLGIDNGVSGSLTILNEHAGVILHIKTPVNNCLNYTKKKSFVNRLDVHKMREALLYAGSDSFCFMERPMINSFRFNASLSAIRCLEATLILLEERGIPYSYIDSKEWQKALFPSGLKGDELKRAAEQVCKRWFPKIAIVNADSMLIAEYCRRTKK